MLSADELADPCDPASWERVRRSDRALVLHDVACPMVTPGFLADCARTVGRGEALAAVRPVTDTVKVVRDGRVGGTVDRERLRAVCSPVVLSAELCQALPALPTTDLAGLVVALRAVCEVRLVEAPTEARRVGSAAELRVLQALTAPPEATSASATTRSSG